jgi:tektin-1
LRDQVAEITLLNRREADHKLDEKLKDIQFNIDEIQKQRKEVCIEIDSLTTYSERILDAMESLKEQSLKICKKCVILREGRIGIDLVRGRS